MKFEIYKEIILFKNFGNPVFCFTKSIISGFSTMAPYLQSLVPICVTKNYVE